MPENRLPPDAPKPQQREFTGPLSGMVISPEEFLRVLEEIANDVVRYHADGDSSSQPPTIFAVMRDPANGKDRQFVFIIDQDFNDADVKHDLLRRAGRKLYEQKLVPVAVFLVSEAWTSHLSMSEGFAREIGLKPHVAPRDDPERRESIVLFGLSLNRQMGALVQFPIVRDADRDIKPVTLDRKELVIHKGAESPLLMSFYRGFFETTSQWIEDHPEESAKMKAILKEEGSKSANPKELIERLRKRGLNE